MPAYRIYLADKTVVTLNAESVRSDSGGKFIFRNANGDTVAEFISEKIVGYAFLDSLIDGPGQK